MLSHALSQRPSGFRQPSAMISCNDGFRPVSFLLETMDEDAVY